MRTVCDLIDRIADAYCWLATDHGGLRTFEGWLLGTVGRQLKLMLEGENEKVRMKAHRARYRSILQLHDAVVEAAGKKDREALLRSLVGLVAATYSSQFKPSTLDNRKKAHAQDFLVALGAKAPPFPRRLRVVASHRHRRSVDRVSGQPRRDGPACHVAPSLRPAAAGLYDGRAPLVRKWLYGLCTGTSSWPAAWR